MLTPIGILQDSIEGAKYLSDKMLLRNVLARIEKECTWISEENAAIMHEIWSNWYKYQRDNSTRKNIERWERQCTTPYNLLSEEEKEKDRKQLSKFYTQSAG